MQPDLILINGRIYVGTSFDQTASSVSVIDGRISEFNNLNRGPKTQVIDLGGRTVIPGFIDSHTHFCRYGRSLSEVKLEECKSIEESLESVRNSVATKQPGEWIRGMGWDQNLWNRWPTRQDLDVVAPNNPVVLTRKDLHAIWVNTRALELVGWGDNTKCPEGGQVDRNPATGKLTGLIREKAVEEFLKLLPKETRQEWISSIRTATQHFHKFGITSVHTMEGLDEFKTLSYLKGTEGLNLRFYTLVAKSYLDEFSGNNLKTGSGDEFLRVGQLKIFLDGTLGSQTAEMLQPFERSDNLGITYTNDCELTNLINRASSSGLSVAMHAIGDKAVRRAIDHLEKIKNNGFRHRIEHVQLIHPADLKRLRTLDLIASVQPIHLNADADIAQEHWGKRSRYAYAFKSLKTSGMRLAFGSDCPVESPAVLPSIEVARSRCSLRGQKFYNEESLPLRDVLQAFTIGGAYASGEESIKGSLDVGKLADMVVLSEDPFDTENIQNLEVMLTLFGGKTVYSKD